ncbi:phage virion morphogenesis protein [Brenneria rubrifaciens]|uniref:Phage virion morphogenesis protein n=1 Tax=Brenneria rubrifaciens TaxID=55213 RepID=A0A4P8QWZ0_9GAMM|nr:phage virion morphogenesis protein [Brenneria rubrifaciens]QCR10019.1 phage virion morphogenesis protein [Brenneria rubrifaciens]
MSNNDALFLQLDEVFNGILAGISVQGRRASARTIAIALRRSQQQRIAGQQNPDGSKYEKRRRKVLRSQTGISFIWNDETRHLKNWRATRGKRGRMLTGFDEDRGAVRSFYRADIARYLNINFAQTKKDTTKTDPMFRRLRAAKWLRTKADAAGATVGFSGVSARIARAHQFGLEDKVGGNASVTYPRRVLLGLSESDRRIVADKMIESMRLS